MSETSEATTLVVNRYLSGQLDAARRRSHENVVRLAVASHAARRQRWVLELIWTWWNTGRSPTAFPDTAIQRVLSIRPVE